jgi:membrane protease subunit HflC
VRLAPAAQLLHTALAGAEGGAAVQPSQDLDRRSGSRARARLRTVFLSALAAAVLALLPFCFFSVDQAEYAVVTQFGAPVQVVTAPGLGLKYPFQSANRFDRRLFVYAPPLSEFLTLEKTAVVASSVILWRIAEPRKFFETVFDRNGAEARLSDILFAELGAAFGRNPLTAFVSVAPGEYRAEDVLERVTETLRAAALRDYGIEVVDVQLQRFDFPERNRLRVYARMKSERARISMKYRSEGDEQGLKIRAAADQEKSRLLSEAYKVSEQHRGQGEAEAAKIYAEALGKAPDYYRFMRTMDATRKFVKPDTTLVLPANSELFGLLYDSHHYDEPDAAAKAAGRAGEVTPMR